MSAEGERRTYHRAKIERLTYVELLSGDRVIARDVSEGGLGFCGLSLPELPTLFPVSLRFWSSGGFKLVAAIVEPVWTDRTMNVGGLRFTYLPNESLEQIRRMVHDGLQHETGPQPLIECRATDMQTAREEWKQASEELKSALGLFRDLNLTQMASDGNLALRNARLREYSARKKYADAVQFYVSAVRRMLKQDVG